MMGIGTSSYGPQGSVDDDAVLRRENLVLEHLPQVRIIASRIHDRLPDHISLEDLIRPVSWAFSLQSIISTLPTRFC
jgi:hypothetical protein